MDNGETPLQRQDQHYKNQEIAEVFTSKPGRPQDVESSGTELQTVVDCQTPLWASPITTAMCLPMKSHSPSSLPQVRPGVGRVGGVF